MRSPGDATLPAIWDISMENRDLWRTFDLVGSVRPFRYDDPDTGQTVAMSLSDNYATLTVGPRNYHFIRETGEFDGWSTAT